MRKLVGAGAILMAGFLAALLHLRVKTEKLRTQRALCQCLLELRRELLERRRGLGEIFALLKEKSDTEALRSFCAVLCAGMDKLGDLAFSEIWNAAADGLVDAAGEESADALRPLAVVLGGSELDRQCAALETAARRIEEARLVQRERLKEEGRLTFGLSLSAGALLVIMLM